MSWRIGDFAWGGGGVLGFAHLGVLEVMEEHGLRPGYIAGTSAGAIVAGLYALDIPLTEIASAVESIACKEEEARRPCIPQLRALALEPLSGIIPGGIVEAILNRVTRGKALSQVSIPLSVVSVDLYTGDTVVFTSHPPTREAIPVRAYIAEATVATAIRASISIPVVFAPRTLDSRILVDGGIKELVPAYEVRRMGADEVVAVDVSSESDKPQAVSGMISVLLRAFSIMEREAAKRHLLEHASLVIQPETGQAGFPTRSEIRRLVEAGRKSAQESMRRWLDLASDS